MTLPSKYRSPNSRNFPTEYVIFLTVLFGGCAIAIYYGILLSVDKYGPGILSGWTIKNTLIFVGFIAMFFLLLLILRRMFRKIIGKTKLWEMTETEYLIFRFGSLMLASVILILGLLVMGFLATDNLDLDP